MLLALKGVTLAILTFVSVIYFVSFIRQLVSNPNALLPQMLAGLMLCGLWIIAAAASRH